MSTNAIPMSGAAFSEIIVDTNSDSTSENDVKSGGGAATVFIVDIDNRNNTDSSFTKIYNATSATVGTTVPDVVIRTTASLRRAILYGFSGTAFATGVSFATVTLGGTGGTTSPSNAVVVKIGLT